MDRWEGLCRTRQGPYVVEKRDNQNQAKPKGLNFPATSLVSHQLVNECLGRTLIIGAELEVRHDTWRFMLKNDHRETQKNRRIFLRGPIY